MFNLDLFMYEFQNREKMRLGKVDAETTHGKGNVLYNIFPNSSVRTIAVSTIASYYVLKLEEDNNTSSFKLNLYPTHDVENFFYYLDYKDNRNFEVSYTNGSEKVGIKSSTITWEQNKVTRVGEQIEITATEPDSKLKFVYVQGHSLKGSCEESFIDDGSKVKVNFDYSFAPTMNTLSEMLDEAVKGNNTVLVALEDGKKYRATFFIDDFSTDIYVPTICLESKKSPFKTIYGSEEAEKIKEEYIYPVVGELMYFLRTPDSIEDLCKLLADPNNLPFEIV